VPRKGFCFVAKVVELEPVEEGPLPVRVFEIEAVGETPHKPPAPPPAETARRVPPRRLYTRAAAAAFALAAVALGFVWARRAERAREAALRVRSVAVLPLKLLPQSGRDDYLGLAFTDALITRLGRIGKLSVRPTDAVRAFTGQAPDAVWAGRSL